MPLPPWDLSVRQYIFALEIALKKLALSIKLNSKFGRLVENRIGETHVATLVDLTFERLDKVIKEQGRQVDYWLAYDSSCADWTAYKY